ncbi:hypothetical protein LEN26_020548 [Aphanomyces euteiches]|nr:hypothetical protein LEN26_020548 [Aphanomyces euteiches]KAH9194946.1 hypothetical protein AeNC1_003088 [Aphanomyces euteiches]
MLWLAVPTLEYPLERRHYRKIPMGGNLSTKNSKAIFSTPDGAIGITYAFAQKYAKYMPFEMKMPVLTPRKVTLIKENWAAICRGTNAFNPERHGSTDKFFHRTLYGLLFAVMPSLRCIFRSSLTMQGKSFASVVKVMTSVMTTNNIAERMQALARGHLKFGVRREDYTTMGVTFIRALEIISGDTWTKEIRDAYMTAYCLLYYLLLPVIAHNEPEPAKECIPATVTSIEIVSNNARRLTISYDFPLRFQPGDGILLGIGQHKRCFPIASFPNKPSSTLELVVDLATSDWICRYSVASQLRLFWVESSVNFEVDTPDAVPRRVLLVSHGLDAVPFVTMMKGLSAIRESYDGNVVALQVADSFDEIQGLQPPELTAWSQCSIHQAHTVTKDKLLEVTPKLAQTDLYVAGPPDFIAQVEREYLAAGGRKRVHVYSLDRYNR